MMQATKIIMRSSNIYESFIPNSVYTQCIRWKRKPIWLPTAKSKLFRVPKRPVIPIEEEIELKRLFNIYRTCISSLRLHIETVAVENNVEFDTINAEKNTQIEEEEDFQKCKAINDEWNANVAKIREARLMVEKQTSKEKVLQQMIERQEKQEKLRKEADEEIRKLKEEAVTFITSENIDAMIEECLANVIDHNRALNSNGNWYDGKYPAVSAVKEMATQPTVTQQ